MHCLGKIAFFFRDNFHNIMNYTTLVNYFYLADGTMPNTKDSGTQLAEYQYFVAICVLPFGGTQLYIKR